MIDFDDVDDSLLWGLLSPGWIGTLFLITAIIYFFTATDNNKECLKKTCPLDQTPKLMQHGCFCITKAK